ncbi:MAG TPA: TolC family protein [Kofleriaceae bacterium]|nr:TolC family protein [Kofleriaceae bacterium]
MSLSAVLEHAVRNSQGLATARIDVAVADATVMEQVGLEDILFNATGAYNRDVAQSDFAVARNGGIDDSKALQGSLSLTKLFFTGATVSVKAETDRAKLLGRDLETGTPFSATEYSSAVTGSITQPILRGGWETVTRAPRTRAQLAAEQARLQREVAGRTVVRDLVEAYWEVAYAWSELDIRRSSLDLARERRRLTDASVRGGATAPTELLAVDQVIAQREEDVVVAELSVTQRSLELRRLAGLEIEPGQIDIKADAPLDAQVRPIEIKGVMTQALARSPEIAALESQGRGAALEIEVTNNGLLPRLDLSVNGTLSGAADNFSDSVSNAANADAYTFGGQLVLEHWIGRHAARGQSRRAEAERERVMINMADMRRQIAQAAAQAVALANSAQNRMRLSTTAIDLTDKNIKAETGRFELGKSSNFDVLLRQEEHTQARLRFARAAADYLRATAVVEALTGEILPRYGIKVE